MKQTNPISTRSYKLKDREDIIRSQVNREDQTTISYMTPPKPLQAPVRKDLTPMTLHSFFSNFIKYAWSFAP